MHRKAYFTEGRKWTVSYTSYDANHIFVKLDTIDIFMALIAICILIRIDIYDDK
jgi:hypothetical protein